MPQATMPTRANPQARPAVRAMVQFITQLLLPDMYIPNHFAQSDLSTLHEAIEHYSFATLVSSAAGEMSASHLPLLLDRIDGTNGTLVGHMARANLQWRDAAGQEV